MSGQMRSSIYKGLGPQPLSSGALGGATAYPYENFQTPLLDLTVGSQLGIELVPARPGYVPVQVLREWIVEVFTGTQVTPATSQSGQNAAHNNFQPLNSTPTNANLNTFVPPFYVTGGAIQPVSVQLATSTTRIFVSRRPRSRPTQTSTEPTLRACRPPASRSPFSDLSSSRTPPCSSTSRPARREPEASS